MKTKTKAEELPITHPGEILLHEFLEPANISQYRLAQATGISVSRINDLVKSRRGVTPDTAIRLGAALGVSAAFWLNLQHEYDMRVARRARKVEYDAIERMPELQAA